MKLHHLKFFVAVVEEGSITAGAERSNATQSGLSTQIRKLEELYQVQLLKRTSRGVVPTEAGKIFYKDAVRTLRSAAAAEENLRALSGSTAGVVNVGLIPTFTRSILAPTLTEFS